MDQRRLNEIEALWQEATDNEVLRAIEANLSGYPAEVQSIIKAEAKKRDLAATQAGRPTGAPARVIETSANSPAKDVTTNSAKAKGHSTKLATASYGMSVAAILSTIAFFTLPLAPTNKDYLGKLSLVLAAATALTAIVDTITIIQRSKTLKGSGRAAANLVLTLVTAFIIFYAILSATRAF